MNYIFRNQIGFPSIFILLIALAVSCTATKKTKEVKNVRTFNYDLRDNDCLEALSAEKGQDNPGPINLRVEIDSVQFGEKRTPIKKVFTATVDKESELLIFGDSLGIKIFHTEARVYGKIAHYIKYDFFIREKDCWRRKISFEFQEATVSTNTSYRGMSSFSQGRQGDENFIKVIWLVDRQK